MDSRYQTIKQPIGDVWKISPKKKPRVWITIVAPLLAVILGAFVATSWSYRAGQNSVKIEDLLPCTPEETVYFIDTGTCSTYDDFIEQGVDSIVDIFEDVLGG